MAKGGEFVWAGKPNSSRLARALKEEQPTVHRWLKGASPPTTTKLEAICEALKLSPSQLMGWEPIDFVDGKDAYLDENEYFLKNFSRLPPIAQKSILHQMQLNLEEQGIPESNG